MDYREKKTNGEGSSRKPLFLVCDFIHGNANTLPSHEGWMRSPIQCLSSAVELDPDFVVIRFGSEALNDRKILVELAAALKAGRYTKKSRVVALLRFKNRKLLEGLHDAGVDFVKYVDDQPAPARMPDVLEKLGPGDRLEKHLATLCPLLHYSEIDSKTELTTCGAYLDRMVLGGFRLREICETENHLHCEYYLNPRYK